MSDVLIVVNNVGASVEMPVPFAESDPEEIDNILQTVISYTSFRETLRQADIIQNFLWTIHLTRGLLPALIARKPKSLILTIGSLNGRIPPPLSAVYGGTKGGLQVWSRALAEEVQSQGVAVYMILAAFVVG